MAELRWAREKVLVQILVRFDGDQPVYKAVETFALVADPFMVHESRGALVQSHPHTLSHRRSGLRLAAFTEAATAKRVGEELLTIVPVTVWDQVRSISDLARVVPFETIGVIRELLEDRGGVRRSLKEMREDLAGAVP